MKVVVALVIGYVIGVKTGGQDLEQLGRAVKALCGTDEFADVVTAARVQAGNTLRGLAGILDGRSDAAGSGAGGDDIMARVRHLVDQD